MYARAVLFLVASLALTALPARAAPPQEQAPPRAPRATLVEVLRGGKQVLVLDRSTGDYAVMKVGDSIQGFRIAAIEDDQMVLIGGSKPERLFVIPLLDRTPLPAMKVPPPAAAGDEPADPYATPAPPAPPAAKAPLAETAPAEEGVMDPYGEPPPTSSPPAAAAPTPTPAPAPAAPPPAETVPAAPATATPPPPAPAAATTAPAPAAKPRGEKRKLSRKELNRALADFTALTRDIKIERATGGGILVTDLAKGSFPARVGIEKGDVVKRVAGHAIDTVDDAASAYAAVMKAKQVVVEIERRGARLHITYHLTD